VGAMANGPAKPPAASKKKGQGMSPLVFCKKWVPSFFCRPSEPGPAQKIAVPIPPWLNQVPRGPAANWPRIQPGSAVARAPAGSVRGQQGLAVLCSQTSHSPSPTQPALRIQRHAAPCGSTLDVAPQAFLHPNARRSASFGDRHLCAPTSSRWAGNFRSGFFFEGAEFSSRVFEKHLSTAPSLELAGSWNRTTHPRAVFG